jgi:hypothetical protein
VCNVFVPSISETEAVAADVGIDIKMVSVAHYDFF